MRHSSGEYDGAITLKEGGGFYRELFGGTQAPDQVAAALHNAGLILDAYPDTMWSAIRAEMDTHRSGKSNTLESYQAEAAKGIQETIEEGLKSGKLLHVNTEVFIPDDGAAAEQGPDEQAAGVDLDEAIIRGLSGRPTLRRVYEAVRDAGGEITTRELGKILGVSHTEAANRKKAMQEAVSDMLAAGLRAHLAANGHIPAFYDRETGKIYVIADNLNSSQDLDDFILTEEMIHAGLHNLFGQDLDRVMGRVYENHAQKEAVRNTIGNEYDLLDENGNWKSEAAKAEGTEEWLAHIYSRKHADPTTWQRFVAWVKSSLRKAGLNLKMSDSEFEVLVSRALRTKQQAHRAKTGGVRAHIKKTRTNSETKRLLDSMEPVVVDSSVLGGSENAQQFRERAKAEYQKLRPVINKDTGRTVHFAMTGFKKLRSHSGDIRTLQVVPRLKELMENAVFLYENSDRNRNDKILAWDTYAARAILDGKPVYVKLVTREEVGHGQVLDLFDDSSVTSEEDIKSPPFNDGPDALSDKDKLRQWYHSVKGGTDEIRAHRYPANRPDEATRRRLAIQKA